MNENPHGINSKRALELYEMQKRDPRGRWIYDRGLVMCSKCRALPWLGINKNIDDLPVRCPKCNTLMKNVREL